jgi:hypothetical protein
VTKPKVFIASSSEGLDAAQAIRGLPAADAHVTMWDEGFELGGAGTAGPWPGVTRPASSGSGTAGTP